MADQRAVTASEAEGGAPPRCQGDLKVAQHGHGVDHPMIAKDAGQDARRAVEALIFQQHGLAADPQAGPVPKPATLLTAATEDHDLPEYCARGGLEVEIQAPINVGAVGDDEGFPPDIAAGIRQPA